MPKVFIPPLLRSLTDGFQIVDVPGDTVKEVVNHLDSRYPGLQQRLCDGDRIHPGLSLTIDDRISSLGLAQRVTPDSEVHFLPAIGGG